MAPPDPLDVMAFGAKGDAVGDTTKRGDTIAIQGALDWIADWQNPQPPLSGSFDRPVGHLYFPPGIYRIEKALRVRGWRTPDNVGAVQRNPTIITLSPAATIVIDMRRAPTKDDNCVFLIEEDENHEGELIIEGGRLTWIHSNTTAGPDSAIAGEKTAFHGIRVRRSFTTIRDVVVSHFANHELHPSGRGIVFEKGSSGASPRWCKVLGCRIFENTVGVEATAPVDGLVISGCRIEHNLQEGVRLNGGPLINVSENVIEGNGREVEAAANLSVLGSGDTGVATCANITGNWFEDIATTPYNAPPHQRHGSVQVGAEPAASDVDLVRCEGNLVTCYAEGRCLELGVKGGVGTAVVEGNMLGGQIGKTVLVGDHVGHFHVGSNGWSGYDVAGDGGDSSPTEAVYVSPQCRGTGFVSGEREYNNHAEDTKTSLDLAYGFSPRRFEGIQWHYGAIEEPVCTGRRQVARSTQQTSEKVESGRAVPLSWLTSGIAGLLVVTSHATHRSAMFVVAPKADGVAKVGKGADPKDGFSAQRGKADSTNFYFDASMGQVMVENRGKQATRYSTFFVGK
jgi:hypothetical protein